MNQAKQPRALKLADRLEDFALALPAYGFDDRPPIDAAAELRRLHARVQELEGRCNDKPARDAAAVRTLEAKGWTWRGAEQWAPPIGNPPDFDLIDSLRTKIAELEAEAVHAMNEASNVARSLFASHYSHEHAYSSGRITWGLCDDVRGVISQISNMCVGLVRDIDPERDHADEDAATAAGKVQAAVQGRV